jgi:hypothetical protein
MSSALIERTQQTVLRLERWFTGNGWAGYDPYDFKRYALYHKLRRLPKIGRWTQRLIDHEERARPGFWRRVLRIPKQINANTVALLARAYLRRHAAEPQGDYLTWVEQCLEWLVTNNVLGEQPKKLGWGYPFTWYAGSDNATVLPANTALSVVTTEGGHAFLDFYDRCADKQALENARRCGRFILEDLPRERWDAEGLCFGYSSLGLFVVNANLNVAAYLTRLSNYIQDPQMLALARQARQLAVSLQNDDGSWYYWVYPERNNFGIDSYHTGMVLQWLWLCQQYDPKPNDRETLTRGLTYYAKAFFADDGTPYLTPQHGYPIDIHCSAQALVTLGLLLSDYPEYCRSLLGQVLSWTLDHMTNPDGSFIYRVYADRVVRIPYTRWGQAWMMWGLSAAMRAMSESEADNQRPKTRSCTIVDDSEQFLHPSWISREPLREM